MYEVIDKVFSRWDLDRYGEPMVTLEDEWGGQSVIGIDDGCFVLYNGSETRDFKSVKHWYPEAAKALQGFLNGSNSKE